MVNANLKKEQTISYIGQELSYSMDDLSVEFKDNQEELNNFLKGIYEKVKAEGSYEALFCDYGLEIHQDDHPRLAKLVKAYTSFKHELDCLFANAGCEIEK